MGDLGVGAVDVDHVDLLRLDGVIGQAVVQARGHVGQGVGLGQPAPAIRATQKFVGQTQLERWVAGQLAEGAHAKCLCPCLGHGQRVAVVKAQRHAHAQSQRNQRAAHLVQGHGLGIFENLQTDRARVLGVHVNGTGAQRLINNGRVTQALQNHRGFYQMRGCLLCDHLRQDVGLGEALGADTQRLGAGVGGR